MRILGRYAVLGLLIGLAPAAARAEGGKLYLSWRAPYGLPRATNTIAVSCRDSLATDTLYMCLDPPPYSRDLYAADVSLLIHSQAPDTLGGYWRMGYGDGDFGNAEAIYKLDRRLRGLQPWRADGPTIKSYSISTSTGSLRLIHAVTPFQAAPVDSSHMYCLGFLVFSHPAVSDGSCEKPVCIEWKEAKMTFDLNVSEEPIGNGGSATAFVGWNQPGGPRCVQVLPPNQPAPWKPKPSGP